LQPVADVRYLYTTQKQALQARIAALGLKPDEHNAIMMWGGGKWLVAVFDPQTLRLRAILKP
jgi:hypothetical protein